MNTGSMNTYIIFDSIKNLTPGPLEKQHCARMDHDYLHMYMYIHVPIHNFLCYREF